MSSKPLNQTSLNIGIHSETITKAAKRMARVFVRLFSSYFQVADLAELVMQAGVEEAERRCRSELPDKKPTLSRLSLMTGIPTAKVKHLQEEPRQASDYYICAEAAILARWAKEPSLRSSVSGEPADLPIFGNEGSFQGLVGKIAGRGISTKTALDRLLANGNVRVVNKHFVRLIDPNWRYIEDDEDVYLEYGTQALASLGSAVLNNLLHRNHPEKKWVERRAYSVRVPDVHHRDLSKAINNLLIKQKDEMHTLLQLYESKENSTNSIAIGAGYYFWQDNSFHRDSDCPDLEDSMHKTHKQDDSI